MVKDFTCALVWLGKWVDGHFSANKLEHDLCVVGTIYLYCAGHGR